MPNLRDLDIGVGGSGRPSSLGRVATRETNRCRPRADYEALAGAPSISRH
jgi:hypothetical protein